MSTGWLSLGAEGLTDQIVLARVAEFSGWLVGPRYGARGKAHLLKQLPKFNNAARYSPWAVLFDLDRSADCAPTFMERLVPPARLMRIRIAVRAVEARLLADQSHLARYLRVSRVRMPLEPDSLVDPKQVIVDIVRHSADPGLRRDIVPREGRGTSEGPAYAIRLQEFALKDWSIDDAMDGSPSLAGCVTALRSLLSVARS